MKFNTYAPDCQSSAVVASCKRWEPRALSRYFMLLGCLTMSILALTVFAPKARAVDKILHNFVGPVADGSTPKATLVNDTYGNLYGTTWSGGANNLGTVFVECAPLKSGSPDIPPCVAGAPAWITKILYSFGGLNKDDGSNPASTLIFGGNFPGRAFTLYGTTYNGGLGGNCMGGQGCGTVFELCAPAASGGCGGAAWTEDVLYRFVGGNFDGGNPFAGVIKDKNDVLYGTTVNNGKNGLGAIYKLAPPPGFVGAWTRTIMQNLDGAPHGANPYAALCCNSNATITSLYGTAVNGGAASFGTVFKLNNVFPYPWIWVYSFTGGADGAAPYGKVVLDASNNLYGTAALGGAGNGTLFKLAQPPVETTLYKFCIGGPPCPDGSNPTAGPTLSGTSLYGTTYNGGSPCAAPGCGTLYEFDLTTSVFNQQYAFSGPGLDGSNPRGGIVADQIFPGNWYGTTMNGGTANLGTVYQVP